MGRVAVWEDDFGEEVEGLSAEGWMMRGTVSSKW